MPNATRLQAPRYSPVRSLAAPPVPMIFSAMAAPRLHNRPLPPVGSPRFTTLPIASTDALWQVGEALDNNRMPASEQQRMLAAAALLLMDPESALHPTLRERLVDDVDRYLRQQGASPVPPLGPDALETVLESLSSRQRADLWAAPRANADDPVLALWRQYCLHGQGLLIQQARNLLQQDGISVAARARLQDLIPANAGTADEVAARTAAAAAALRALGRQCLPALQSLQQLDQQLHWREWTQAVPAVLGMQVVGRAVAHYMPSTALFRLMAALPTLCSDPPTVPSLATVVHASTPSEALSAINGLLEKGILTPALLLQTAASIAISPVGGLAALLIGAVACGIQEGLMARLLQRTGVPRLEAAKCIVELQRLQASGASAWSILQAVAAPLQAAMGTLPEHVREVDAVKAQIDAIDDIHRVFQGSLLDEERVTATRQRYLARISAIDGALRDPEVGDPGILLQERTTLQTGLSLLDALSTDPDALLRNLDALHDVRAQLVEPASSPGRTTLPGWLTGLLPAALVGVGNVLPRTLQDIAPAAESRSMLASTAAGSLTRTPKHGALAAIRRNPVVALGSAAALGLTAATLWRHAVQSPDDAEGDDVSSAAGTLLAQARIAGSPGPAAGGSSPLCIGVYLHDDLLPTETRILDIDRKYFSWLLEELRSIFPGKQIQIRYMKRVPGITDMAYRTWFDPLQSLETFYLKAVEHRMGGAVPSHHVQKYLLMTESSPSVMADGIAGKYAAIASNNRYVVPAHEIGHMLDAEHDHSSVHYNGWWCETIMGGDVLNLLRSSCHVFSAENRKRMRSHQEHWDNSPLL